jgi:purine nucleosidase
MKTQLVIDTDAGTDCDDLFALSYVLRNLYCDVKAISTVIGNTIIRAKVTKKLERLLGVNVPIIAGEKGPKESVKKYWTGIEELALTKEELNESFQNNQYPIYTKDTRLVCIGPLTNILNQLQTNPTIRNVRNVYVMGSSDSSHNFKADLEAWKKVQEQPWNIYQVTKEVSERVSFTRFELGELRVNPLGDFLYESATRWLDYTKRDRACMYDVLTVSSGLGEGLVKFKKHQNNRFVSTDVDSKLKDKLVEVIKQ